MDKHEAKLRAYIRENINVYDKGTLRYRCRLKFVYMGLDKVFRITDEELARLEILGEGDA